MWVGDQYRGVDHHSNSRLRTSSPFLVPISTLCELFVHLVGGEKIGHRFS